MGTRFSKRVNIAPGLSMNVGKRGVSVSVGGPGLRKTYSKDGVRTTVGIPGSGLSHTSYHRYGNQSSRSNINPTRSQVSIRTRGQNNAWGWVLLILAIGTVIASFAIPNIIEFGRWVIAILCGGFFLIGAIVFFTSTSKEDIQRQANYLHKLNKVGEDLEETQRLLDQKKQEIQ